MITFAYFFCFQHAAEDATPCTAVLCIEHNISLRVFRADTTTASPRDDSDNTMARAPAGHHRRAHTRRHRDYVECQRFYAVT